MLWPLFKRLGRGGLWAVQALVPGDSLRDLWLVACLFGCRVGGGLGIDARGSNDSRVSKDPLRDDAGSLGRP
jgi:hypothetical protein